MLAGFILSILMDRHEEAAFHAYLVDSQFKDTVVLPHPDQQPACLRTPEDTNFTLTYDGDNEDETDEDEDELPLTRPVLRRQHAVIVEKEDSDDTDGWRSMEYWRAWGVSEGRKAADKELRKYAT